MPEPLKSEKIDRRASVPNENSDTQSSEISEIIKTSDTKTMKRGSLNLHRRLDWF